MDKYKTGDHDGIRIVTSIGKDNIDLIRAFLKIGVQVRHVKNLPPIDFSGLRQGNCGDDSEV